MSKDFNYLHPLSTEKDGNCQYIFLCSLKKNLVHIGFMKSIVIYNTVQYNMIKGLRPVLEGFVVPMHEGACETGSQIPRA